MVGLVPIPRPNDRLCLWTGWCSGTQCHSFGLLIAGAAEGAFLAAGSQSSV
jgi:hypothetical protein